MKDNRYPGSYPENKSSKPDDKFEKLLLDKPVGHRGKFKELLEDLQANIVKSHHRNFSYCLFLHFFDPVQALAWIGNLQISSAKSQLDEDGTNSPVTCFYLTYKGYEALGLKHVCPFTGKHDAFINGMKGRVSFPYDKDFSDPKLYPKHENGGFLAIHAMLFLADNDSTRLINTVGNQKKAVSPLFANTAEQQGLMKFNAEKKAVEWFGFRDGISRPYFFPDASSNKKIRLHEDEMSPLRILLVNDKGGDHWCSAGSFLAFLKLEQDALAFDNMVTAVGKAANAPNRELAEAYIVGRFRNGDPVTINEAPTPNSGNPPENNFDYTHHYIKETSGNKVDYLNDDIGNRCPFHAHIRKANPRFADAEDNSETRLIVRRGIMYDDRTKEARENDGASAEESPNVWEEKDKPKENAGMLFMSFQSNIEEQFEHILNKWMLSPNNGGASPATGMDMLTGAKDGQNLSRWYVPTEWNDPNPNKKSLVQLNEACVRFKGGEYFFAPSLSFLKSVSKKTMRLSSHIPVLTIHTKQSQKPAIIPLGAFAIPPIIIKK